MTISLMMYGAVVAFLLAGAAHFLDRGLRSVGKPTRWVWLGAMVGGAAAPFLPSLVPAGRTGTGSGTLGFPLEVLYDVGALGAAGSVGSAPALLTAEGSLATLWFLSSLFVLMAFTGVCLRFRRQRRTWETREVGGEEVLLSGGLGPAVLGLVRPWIVLPPWALTLSDEQLDLVVLHEKEHREARDPALLAGGLLLTSISPWNPVLWWILQRLRLAVEGDCDGRVLARGVPPRSYGRLLLEVASRSRGLPAMAPALTEGGNTFLEKRLLMIRSFVGKHRVWAGLLAGVAGAALVVVACETPMPQEVPEPEVAAQLSTDSDSQRSILLLTGPDVDRALETVTGKGTGDPLVYIDGVRLSDPTVLHDIDKADIDRIEVIKGRAAEVLYGEEAANGVLQVFLTEPGKGSRQRDAGRVTQGEVGELEGGRRILLRGENPVDGTGRKPLVFIDGVRMDREAQGDVEGLGGIDADDIDRIEVIKGVDAIARYGEDAAAGVILIFTKKK